MVGPKGGIAPCPPLNTPLSRTMEPTNSDIDCVSFVLKQLKLSELGKIIAKHNNLQAKSAITNHVRARVYKCVSSPCFGVVVMMQMLIFKQNFFWTKTHRVTIARVLILLLTKQLKQLRAYFLHFCQFRHRCFTGHGVIVITSVCLHRR